MSTLALLALSGLLDDEKKEMEKVGEIVPSLGPSNGEISVEWRIKDFFSLYGDAEYRSPIFGFSDMCLYLILAPDGEKESSSEGYLGLYLGRKDSGAAKKIPFTVFIKCKGDQREGQQLTTMNLKPKDLGSGWSHFYSRQELWERKTTLMPRNILTFKVILKNNNLSTIHKGLRNLSNSFHTLLTSGKGSDFVIQVQDDKFPVHKTILSVTSPVFETMLTHDMMEKNSGVMTISDCDPLVFRLFLEYIYTGSTLISKQNVFDLHVISDKYDVESLKEECSDFIRRNLTLDTFCDVIKLAANHNDKELLDYASNFFCANSLDIVETESWKTLLEENSAICNELFIKTLKKQ